MSAANQQTMNPAVILYRFALCLLDGAASDMPFSLAKVERQQSVA